MALASDQAARIEPTENGWSIAGTRITLFDVMDYLAVGHPAWLIREKLCLSNFQIEAALRYIEANRTEVEASYKVMLQQVAENRRYWEQRNRDRLAKIAVTQSSETDSALNRKLQAWKDQLESQV